MISPSEPDHNGPIVALLPLDESSSHSGTFVRLLSGVPTFRFVQPAGLAYNYWVDARVSGRYDKERQARLGNFDGAKVAESEEPEDEFGDDSDIDEADIYLPQRERKNVGKKKGSSRRDDEPEINFYAVLGLGKYGPDSTDEQIRKAYRKMLLKFHPDKATVDPGTDPRFLKVQKAYETLSDISKRRSYDSVFDFDESIPTGLEPQDADFFALYGPVFRRNARFSEVQPVPALGNADTPYEEVAAFYEFWHGFESWRDFSADLEHNPETADSRDERRWMEKQNRNILAKLKKKEYKRLKDLVSRAKAHDPRVTEHFRIERERQRQLKMKQTAAAEAKAKAEADAREEEAAKKAASEAASRLKADKLKQERQRGRKTLKKIRKKLVAVSAGAIDATDAEYIVKVDEYNGGSVDAQIAEMEILCSAGVDAIVEAVANAKRVAAEADIARRNALRKEKEEASKRAEKKRLESAVPWSKEELASLVKATKKFPAGSGRRWEQISQMVTKTVQNVLGLTHERSAEECIAKARSVSAKVKGGGGSAPGAGQENSSAQNKDVSADDAAWTQQQQRQLEAALREFPASMEKNDRWRSIAGAVSGKNKKECVARFKFLRAKAKTGSSSKVSDQQGSQWNLTQQQQLEQALRKFPASMEKKIRWSSIADAVDGKSKKDCIARFKELRVLAKQQQKGKV